MWHLLRSFGDVFSVLLIAMGIAILIWNITVQAGTLGKHPKRKLAVATPAPPRESEHEMRVRLRDPEARWR